MLSASNINNNFVRYVDESAALYDTIITKQIAALRDSNAQGTPVDLLLAASGSINLSLAGSNALSLYQKGAADATTVIRATRGQAIELSPGDNVRTLSLANLTLRETATVQQIQSTKDTIEIVDDLQIVGNEVVKGDLLVSGGFVASSMNILRSFSNAESNVANMIGFGFRVTDNCNLELVKYDNRSNTTKRVALFGTGNAAVAANDTDHFTLYTGSNAATSNSVFVTSGISGGLSLGTTPWVEYSTSNIAFTGTGNVGVATSAPLARLHIVSTSDADRSNAGLLIVDVAGSNPVTVDASGRLGVGTTSPAYAVDVVGAVNASSDVHVGSNLFITGNMFTTSDRRVKEDLVPVDYADCTDALSRMDMFRFRLTTTGNQAMGWIAQDVRDVLPEAVTLTQEYGYADFHRLNQDVLYRYMYGSLRHAHARIEALEARLAGAGI